MGDSNMVKKVYYILLVGLCVLNACNKNDDKFIHISPVPTVWLEHEDFIDGDAGLNVFYDICAKDSLLYCVDFLNDTIMKVFSVESPSTFLHYTLKGNGPDDLILPVFDVASSLEYDKVKLLDINLWRVKEVCVNFDKRRRLLKMDSSYLLPAIPAIKEFSITENYIYGTDVEMKHGAFFVYDRNDGAMKVADYGINIDNCSSKFSEKALPFLLEGVFSVNEIKNTICYGMKNLNIVSFYDALGELQKNIIIGNQITYPSANSKFLDFSDAPKYITSMSGTHENLYCLYQGSDSDVNGSRILQFDWAGNLKEVIQLDVNLEKISVNPNDKYIYGTMMTEEGGTNVVRFSLFK